MFCDEQYAPRLIQRNLAGASQETKFIQRVKSLCTSMASQKTKKYYKQILKSWRNAINLE